MPLHAKSASTHEGGEAYSVRLRIERLPFPEQRKCTLGNKRNSATAHQYPGQVQRPVGRIKQIFYPLRHCSTPVSISFAIRLYRSGNCLYTFVFVRRSSAARAYSPFAMYFRNSVKLPNVRAPRLNTMFCIAASRTGSNLAAHP